MRALYAAALAALPVAADVRTACAEEQLEHRIRAYALEHYDAVEQGNARHFSRVQKDLTDIFADCGVPAQNYEQMQTIFRGKDMLFHIGESNGSGIIDIRLGTIEKREERSVRLLGRDVAIDVCYLDLLVSAYDVEKTGKGSASILVGKTAYVMPKLLVSYVEEVCNILSGQWDIYMDKKFPLHQKYIPLIKKEYEVHIGKDRDAMADAVMKQTIESCIAHEAAHDALRSLRLPVHEDEAYVEMVTIASGYVRTDKAVLVGMTQQGFNRQWADFFTAQVGEPLVESCRAALKKRGIE